MINPIGNIALRSENTIRSQCLDLLGSVSGLPQDFLVMLAGHCWWTVDDAAATGEFESRCDERHIAVRCLDGL